MRFRLWRLGLPVALVTVLLGLAGAEFAVRMLQPVPTTDLLPLPGHHAQMARLAAGDTYLQFDADLGWTPRPNVHIVDDGIVMAANAAGMRASRDYAPLPAAGTTRVAAFGDSFVHCDEVDLEACWTAQLEAAWPQSEVLNFGIPAGAPDQGLLRYRRDGRQLQPCAVVIGFLVENVNRVVNRYRPFYSPQTGVALGKPRFVLDGDGLRLLPNPATSLEQLNDPAWVDRHLGPDDFWHYPGMFVPSSLDQLMLFRLGRTAQYRQHRAAIDPPAVNDGSSGTAYQPQDERFQVTGRLLVQFAREVQADGATPVVVIFGQKDEVILVRHRDPKPYQPLLDWLASEQIPMIDVTDDLAREANRSGTDGLFARNGHYNRRGNQVVGASLAKRLPELTAANCR